MKRGDIINHEVIGDYELIFTYLRKDEFKVYIYSKYGDRKVGSYHRITKLFYEEPKRNEALIYMHESCKASLIAREK